MSKNTELFKTRPIKSAVLSLAVPTIVSQLITVIYNMADTFFIGRTNDSNQVAAATVAMPLFMIFTAFSNLFGIGGSSLISRFLGAGETKRAQKTATFCIISGGALALFYGIVLIFTKQYILPLLGSNSETYAFASSYVFWTVTVGALPTIMNPLLAHLVRAEGYSKQASIGVAMGGIINMILDPIFIFGLKLQITGAAIATFISNLIALLYFVLFIYSKRKTTVIKPSFKDYSLRGGIPFEVISVGLPSFAISFMASISNSVLNRMMSTYSNFAVAGMGIAKKINLMAFAVTQGITQGALPLIGYNYAAKNKKRMKDAIKTTFIFSISAAFVLTVILFFFAPNLCRAFIDNQKTVEYAKRFLKIICLACPGTTLGLWAITVFQAVGKKVQPIILSMLRKGGLDVPFMLIFDVAFGVNGIAFATPVGDTLAAVIALTMFAFCYKRGGFDPDVALDKLK